MAEPPPTVSTSAITTSTATSAAATANRGSTNNQIIAKDETVIKPAAVKIIREGENLQTISSIPFPFGKTKGKGATKSTKVILTDIAPKLRVRSPPKAARKVPTPTATPSFSKAIPSDIRTGSAIKALLENENSAPTPLHLVEKLRHTLLNTTTGESLDVAGLPTEKNGPSELSAMAQETENVPAAAKIVNDTSETQKTESDVQMLNLSLNTVDYVLKSNSNALNIKTNNVSRKSAAAVSPENPKSEKKAKCYNQDKAREYMRIQKQKRRFQHQTMKSKNVENDKELIKQRLEDLNKHSLKIVDKNVQKARRNSTPKFESKTSKFLAADNNNASKKLKITPSLTLKLKPSATQSSSSAATVPEKKANSDDAITRSSISSERMATLNKRILHLTPDKSHNIGMLRKPNVSLNASTSISSPFKSLFDAEVADAQLISAGEKSVKVMDTTTSAEKVITPPPPAEPIHKIEEEIKLQVPETTLQSASLFDDHRVSKTNVPYWLKQSYVQPYPYNFLKAVQKKLEACTESRLKAGHSDKSWNLTDASQSKIAPDNNPPAKARDKTQNVKEPPHFSPVSVNNSEPNTISEISSIKSETFIPMDSPNRTRNETDLDVSATTPPGVPQTADARLSPLSKDVVTQMKINMISDLPTVNAHRGSLMPSGSKMDGGNSFRSENASANVVLREDGRQTMNNTEIFNNFLQKNNPDTVPQQQDDYKQILAAFNKNLSQVIEVTNKLYAVSKLEDIQKQKMKKRQQKEAALMEDQSQIIVSIDMNNSNYSDDFEKHSDTSMSTHGMDEKKHAEADQLIGEVRPPEVSKAISGGPPPSIADRIGDKSNYFQPITNKQEDEYEKIAENNAGSGGERKMSETMTDAAKSNLHSKSKLSKKNDDIGETIKAMKIVNMWSETEMTNDIYSSAYNQSDLEVSYKSNNSGNNTILSETNISYSSFGMVEQSIKAESIKSKHLTDMIKIREKSLIDRTKAQINLLQLQKQKFREQGLTLQIPPIKKRQRALLVKLEKDIAEMKKMTTAPTYSVGTRTGHKFEKINLKLIDIRNTKSSVRQDGQRQKAIKGFEIKPGKDLEIILLKRETELRKRRETVEHLLKWHQKLNEEENHVAELEEQLFNYNFAKINPPQKDNRSAHSCKKIRQIEKSIRILQNISLISGGDDSSVNEDCVEISGDQINKLWKRLTGHRERKFDVAKNYKMTKTDLEKIYEEAKAIVLQEFQESNKIDKLMYDSFVRPTSDHTQDDRYKTVSEESLVKPAPIAEIAAVEEPEEKSEETLKEKSTKDEVDLVVLAPAVANITPEKPVEAFTHSTPTTDEKDSDNKFSESSLSNDFTEDPPEIAAEKNDEEKSGKATDDSIAEILETVKTGATSSSTEHERTYEIIRDLNNDSENDAEDIVPDSSEPENNLKASDGATTQKSSDNEIESESFELQQLIDDISFPNYDPTLNETNLLNSIQKTVVDSNDDNIVSQDNIDKTTTDNDTANDITISNNSGEYKSDKVDGEIDASLTASTSGDLKNRLMTLNNSLEELSGAFERAPIMDLDYNKQLGPVDNTPSSSMSTTQDDYSTDKDFDLDIELGDTSDDKYSGSIVKNLEEELKEQYRMEVKIRNKNAEDLVGAGSTSSGSSCSSSTVKDEIADDKDKTSVSSSVLVTNYVSVMHDYMPLDYNTKMIGTPAVSTAANRIMPDIINEAEVLRRQQLQIEQEIKQLEQQVPYALLREIPNKPPPPYIPPAQSNRLPLIFPEETRFNELITNRIEQLYNNNHTDNQTLREDEEADAAQSEKSQNGNIYETIILDLCNELYREFRTPAVPNPVTFKVPKNYKKPLAFFNPPDDLKCLQKYITEKIKKILVPSDNHLNAATNMPESCRPIPTGVFCFTKRKRDHVDEILVQEMLEEEEKWTNFDEEEIQVKNEVTNDIINKIISDALSDIEDAFNNKRKKCT